MPLKSRLQSAIRLTRDSRSSTSSSSNSTVTTGPNTPTPTIFNGQTGNISDPTPTITLTKTSSSRLSRTLTWGSKGKEAKKEKKLRDWERCDEEEWRLPRQSGRKGGKGRDGAIQEVVRGWQLSFGRNSIDGARSASMYSGVSPCTSRMNSVDGEQLWKVLTGGRQRSVANGGRLSRDVGRGDGSLHVGLAD